MKIKDYILGLLAGFILIAFWYGQLFLSWLDFNMIILMYVYPLVPAIFFILFVKHKRIRYLFFKLGLSLLSFLLFSFLATNLDLEYKLLNIAIPGYGRLIAGGRFGVMMLTIPYLFYNGIAILISFFLVSLEKKESEK